MFALLVVVELVLVVATTAEPEMAFNWGLEDFDLVVAGSSINAG